MRRGILPAIAIVLTAATAYAHTGAPPPTPLHRPQVEGQVLDREGTAVAGATVVVRPVGLAVTLGVAARTFELVTDRSGRFHLDGVPPGTYWFIAYGVGNATGSTPALPIVDQIDVSIRLDDRWIVA